MPLFEYFLLLSGEENLFWFFSTIVQAQAALAAVIGMYAVYLLQQLSNQLDSHVLHYRGVLQKFGCPDVEYMYVGNLKKVGQQKIEEIKNEIELERKS